MRIFGIQSDGNSVEFDQEPFQVGHTEETLHDWLEANPEGILENSKLLIIGREVQTDLGGRIDLLGVDPPGNVVVVELKKGRTPRETVAQVLEYAAFAERLNADQLETICQTYMNDESLNFAVHHKRHFALEDSDAVTFNKDQRIVIVCQEISPQIRQTALFLNSKSVSVTCVEFSFFQTKKGDRILSQEIVVSEESYRPVRVSSRSAPTVDEATFLASLDDNNRPDTSRLIEWSKEKPRGISWGTKAFATHVFFDDSSVSVFRVYPPGPRSKQVLFLTFNEIEKKSAVPKEVIQDIRKQAESTGLFKARGSKDLQRIMDSRMSDAEMNSLLKSLEVISEAIQYHGPKR